MLIDAGRKPDMLRLRLIPNSDFGVEFTSEDESFPIEPAFYFPLDEDTSMVWTATLSADRMVATWQVPLVDVDALIAASVDRKARLILGSLVWAEGRFEVASD